MKGKPPASRNTGTPRMTYVLRGESEGRQVVYLLHPGENTLGRAQDCDISIADPSVSRRHAVVLWTGQEVCVKDQGSHNGTFVNGCPVTQAILKVGDTLALGATKLSLALAPLDDVQPVILAVSAVESEDGVHKQRKPSSPLAVRSQGISAEATVGINSERREDYSTAGDGWIPAQWLEVLGALVGGGERTPLDVAGLLHLLVTRLGASAALWVELAPRKGVVVRECVGAYQVDVVLPRLQGILVGEPNGPHAHPAWLLDGDPPLVVGVQWNGKAAGSGLVLVGEFAARKAVPALIKHLLFLLVNTPEEREQPQPAFCHSELVFPPGHVVGSSAAMKAVYRELQYLIRGNLPLLITGETGVGKEHIARVVHASSDRAKKPFVAVNCPGTNAELFEAELFGVEDRVATGVAKRDGKLKLADGGVALLDEVGELPPTLQAKLLRTLQESEIYPVGAAYPVKIDVRIIAATNADLPELVEQGRFRHDLYHRLAGVTIRVPPLRERREDIPALAVAFMTRFARELGVRVTGLTERALRLLQEASWPGNVRELEHVIKRAVLLCPAGQPITSELLALEPARRMTTGGGLPGDDLNLERRYSQLERELIERALERTRGKISKAAALLGISRQALRKKINASGIRYEP